MAGRRCARCDATLEEGAVGKACEDCDVVLCDTCREDDARCPRCERELGGRDVPEEKSQPEPDTTVERGRKQAVAVSFSVIGGLVLLGFLSGQLASVPLSLFVFGLLFFQLFRGRAWARWLIVFLVGGLSVTYALAAFSVFRPNDAPLFSAAFAAMFAWNAFVMALSPPLGRFLEAQRQKNG